MEKIRNPVVAGAFYPSNPENLKNLIKGFFGDNFKVNTEKLISPMGVIVPHAGYIYSGETAAKAYKKIFEKGIAKRVFMLGPNHTGLGSKISIFTSGSWKTPLGKIKVDEKTTRKILKDLDIHNDEFAHLNEHSLEVQLPFLQYAMGNNFEIVPICMMDQGLETSKNLGKILANIIEEGDLVIASSDMNHYESHEKTLLKDEKVIETLKKMNLQEMYDTIRRYNISMCGYGPVAVLLSIGFTDIEIIDHTTSGEKSGDYEAVVGYLSAIFSNLQK
jgi:hypothetical protein